MPAKKNGQQDDALIMVFLRNEFYKKKFYFALVVYLLSFIIIAVLIWVLVYLVNHPTHPLYFVTDKVGRFVQDVPLTSTNMSNDEVAAWAVEAVESSYSYDFVNYRAQLQSAQKYFTDYGWAKYMNGLKASNNLIALSERRFIIIAKVVEKPKLITTGIVGGAAAWKFEIPLLVTYQSPPYDEKSRFQNPLLLSVVIQRQSLLTSYKGLGIIQLIGNIVYSTPQNLSTKPQ